MRSSCPTHASATGAITNAVITRAKANIDPAGNKRSAPSPIRNAPSTTAILVKAVHAASNRGSEANTSQPTRVAGNPSSAPTQAPKALEQLRPGPADLSLARGRLLELAELRQHPRSTTGPGPHQQPAPRDLDHMHRMLPGQRHRLPAPAQA